MRLRARPLTTLAMAALAALSVSVAAAATAVASPPASSAAKRTVWLCKPGKPDNPCQAGLSTTRFSPSGQREGAVEVRRQRPRPIDCFYVYPTVSDQTTVNANRRIDPEERSIALYQAARYSQHCRVFAPMYRQLTLRGIGVGGSAATSARGGGASGDRARLPAGPREIAYGDVRAAWNDYLRHYNHGRGVVLIGHSQGSFMLRRLVTEIIDRRPAQRRRLVSAILLGGDVLVEKGRGIGGDFKHVPACRSKKQTGCVIAFSTFDRPVPPDSLFGRTDVPGERVLCTNPAALGGGSAPITPIHPSAPFAPGTIIAAGIQLLGVDWPSADTTWVSSPKAYTARCSSAGGADVLQVRPRRGAPVINPSPDASWGLHLDDANIALGNLVSLVGRQARSFVKKRRQHRRAKRHRRHHRHGAGRG